MRKELIFGLLGGVISFGVALAQTSATPTTTTPVATTPAPTAIPAPATPGLSVAAPTPLTAPLATTTPVTATELGVAERPGFFTLFGLRLQRFFALGDIAKARVTEQLARTVLQQARLALAQGDTVRAQTLLNQYNAETTRASQLVSTGLSQVDLTANPAAQALVSQLEQSKILEAAAIDAMSLKATGEFNKRLINERAEIAKKLVKLLTKEDLAPAELERKIVKLTAKLAEKEAKAEEKFAKRLATLDLLDEAANQNEPDQEELDEAIGNVEEDEIAALASQPAASLPAFVSKIPGSTTKHLVVLQALLDRVPDQAKGTIGEVLAKELEKAKTKLQKGQAKPEELVDEDSAQFKQAKDEVLAKLQDKADEKTTKAIEQATKKLQKAEERRIKRLEKQKSKKDLLEQGEETKESSATATPAATTTPSPSPAAQEDSKKSGSTSATSGSTSTSVSEPKTYKIELEQDGFKTTNLSINAGDSVIFEIKDEGSYQIRSGPHPTHIDIPELDSGVVAKGAKYTFKFTKAGTFRFHDHLHTNFTGTITVK
ncbi:cupredoxin domain-containing protein [Candidatus Berkelbacteria bacterium]|nr:cupredoxin domain-containing protein [Candidatus Berkelbacteria bacterium]